jgi:hypothetical protein
LAESTREKGLRGAPTVQLETSLPQAPPGEPTRANLDLPAGCERETVTDVDDYVRMMQRRGELGQIAIKYHDRRDLKTPHNRS